VLVGNLTSNLVKIKNLAKKFIHATKQPKVVANRHVTRKELKLSAIAGRDTDQSKENQRNVKRFHPAS
jgi:hypothetical protein